MKMNRSDNLSRQPFIDLLKNIIEHQSKNGGGYSIAIDGEWGCGKTWILNELEAQLGNQYLVFRYNVWENDFYEEPLVALLSVMIKKLNAVTTQKSVYEAAVDELLKVVSDDLINIVSGIVKGVTKIDTEKFIKSIKNIIKRIKDRTKLSLDIDTMLPLHNAVQKVRSNLEKLLSKKISIIFIVDELDRCLPEYAIKVLERLHHVCNEMLLLQLIAINKKDLSFGIAKVFGVANQNIDSEKFADKYLQKFVQFFVPLNNGQICDEERILNHIDDDYVPAIAIDKPYLLDFYKKLMNGITPRTQEYIQQQVALVHKLTVLSGHELEEYSYGLLCCEFMYCVKTLIFRDKSNFLVKHKDGQIFSLSSQLKDSDECQIISVSQFNKNLDSIFDGEYGFYADFQLSPRVQDKKISGFSCSNGSAQLMNYFVEHYYIRDKFVQVHSMDSVIQPEREFLSHFRNVLQNL